MRLETPAECRRMHRAAIEWARVRTWYPLVEPLLIDWTPPVDHAWVTNQ